MKDGRDLFVGRREAGLDTGWGQEHIADFLDELDLRFRYAAGCLLLFVRPEAVADFKHQLRAAVSDHAADGTRLQFIQAHGDGGWRSRHHSCQIIDRGTEAPGVAIGVQTEMNIELEGAIGEQGERLSELAAGGEPAGGLFELQARRAHERPPLASASPGLFFLRVDSPLISMR